VVAALPPAPSPASVDQPEHELLARAIAGRRSVLRLPPATNLVHVALAAASLGNALVLCPNAAMAGTVTERLRRAGVRAAAHPTDWARGAAGGTVVGTRAAAWAPVGDLACIVVLDEHDESHQQEQSPTWHARDVAIERARRAGIPCVLTSPCPTLEALDWGDLHAADRARDRAGWPVVEVVDQREQDPRHGLLSDVLARRLREGGRALCVLNRTGRAKLLACRACGELARCAACDAAVHQPDTDLLCPRCAAVRPPVCAACGAGRFRTVRAGVTRVREELEALVGEPVAEVTATTKEMPSTRVLVGTEAVLQRVQRADLVAFLDLDQELLAPRYRAVEQALALVARAARVVAASAPPGSRAAGRLLLQTRLPDDDVVQAAVRADVGAVTESERARRTLLRFPPVSAMAEISGPSAPAFVEALGAPSGTEVVEAGADRWWVRAPDHRTLCDALAGVTRPSGRLRIEVDPLRL
jgi:primosomal protein N' (replication factor Y)